MLQLLDRRSLKGDHVSCVDHFSVEHPCLFLQINSRLIALVGHDFLSIPIPASVRNLCMEATPPRPVSFCGGGRWNTARTPLSAIRTREPRPSEISAP